MKFIDEVIIEVASGKGGDGAVSFRREKYVPLGGPDGGNGGDGGNVIFVADEGFNTLIHFRGRKAYIAPDGQKGLASLCNGHNGQDIILKVPPGTIIWNEENGTIIKDLTTHGDAFVIAEGGRGGVGNKFYQTSTNQAPDRAMPGKPGQSFKVRLELKLLADIALIGLPNAGKSTLISSISSARPKIADYPFTTLEPHLGVAEIDDKTIVIADIPGLIEDASEGKGLGIKFLKHIERTAALVHLVDCSMLLEPFEALDQYSTVRNELIKYNPELENKKEIVCLTKIDAMTDEEITKFQEFMEEILQKKVLPISGVSGRNLDLLKRLMLKTKEN